MSSCKAWVIRVLRACLARLEPHPRPDVFEAVRNAVVWADGFEAGTSGDYKSYQVKSKLHKLFPDVRRRDMGLWIEQVLQERS